MNGAASYLKSRKASQALYTKEGFYKQEEGGSKKLLAKEKKEVLQAPTQTSSLGGRERQTGLTKLIISLLLIGNFQVDCSVKVTFLKDVATAARS